MIEEKGNACMTKYYAIKDSQMPLYGIFCKSRFDRLGLEKKLNKSSFKLHRSYREAALSFSQCEEVYNKNQYIAYTDGSYKNGMCTYGFVILRGFKIVYEFFDRIKGYDCNVAENLAVSHAIAYFREKNIENPIMCVDSQHSIRFFKPNYRNIKFIKIKSHSNDPFNFYVDMMLSYTSGNKEKQYGIFKKKFYDHLRIK